MTQIRRFFAIVSWDSLRYRTVALRDVFWVKERDNISPLQLNHLFLNLWYTFINFILYNIQVSVVYIIRLHQHVIWYYMKYEFNCGWRWFYHAFYAFLIVWIANLSAANWLIISWYRRILTMTCLKWSVECHWFNLLCVCMSTEVRGVDDYNSICTKKKVGYTDKCILLKFSLFVPSGFVS